MGFWPRYGNNHLTNLSHNRRLRPATFNLGQKATLREQPSTLAKRPRYANNLQPWPKGHATRTTFNLLTFNLQPSNLQPSTF
ncbi:MULTISPECIES: hypothetical protein [unclassified Moorena]|uniref:hypothetical protein n=1 Tax=unclassified Moorena TaxID=2683338 RepID=UPI0013CA8DD8|nr:MULTISPECIES: hypothetical protein [unclassified Moorena]NEO19661.1 hypothetical protein [Moorena sp. SIO4A5]NEQ59171.1 hypothetical protein [Moorena sp. SIO4A1]